MVDLSLTAEETRLVSDALEVIYQIDGLGFSESERGLAVDIMESLQESINELTL